jgi:hypothetical protein
MSPKISIKIRMTGLYAIKRKIPFLGKATYVKIVVSSRVVQKMENLMAVFTALYPPEKIRLP